MANHEIGPELVEQLREQGIPVETVGNLLGDSQEQEPEPVAKPFFPMVLDGTPLMPRPGIYFDMPDDVYHAIPALSNSGIKKLGASPMIFWAYTKWLNERQRAYERENPADEKEHLIFGRAYHCRICEGQAEYLRRYAIELNPADYPMAIKGTEAVKASIERHEYEGTVKEDREFTEEQPVKPVSKVAGEDGIERNAGKDDWIEQLKALDPSVDTEGMTVTAIKSAIGTFKEQVTVTRKVDVPAMLPVKPWRKVPDTLPDGTEYERSAVSADWVRQLMELEPTAVVWDNIVERHRKENAGKVFLTPEQGDELEVAARMIERDPELSQDFQGGFAEVVLIWFCPRTGVPMKARVDYLKLTKMVDLKSIRNQRERSIETAIRYDISGYKYNLQPVVYWEGADAVRALIRQGGDACIAVHPFTPPARREAMIEFAHAWAQQEDGQDEWKWIFQQKGRAPITRGVTFPRGGETDMTTGEMVRHAKRSFLINSETFGTDSWLDIRPSYMIADEEIPQSATEF